MVFVATELPARSQKGRVIQLLVTSAPERETRRSLSIQVEDIFTSQDIISLSRTGRRSSEE